MRNCSSVSVSGSNRRSVSRSGYRVDSYVHSSSVDVLIIWFITATTKWIEIATTSLTRVSEKRVRKHAKRSIVQLRLYGSSVMYFAASCMSLKDDGVWSRSARSLQNSSMDEMSSSVEREMDLVVAVLSLCGVQLSIRLWVVAESRLWAHSTSKNLLKITFCGTVASVSYFVCLHSNGFHLDFVNQIFILSFSSK